MYKTGKKKDRPFRRIPGFVNYDEGDERAKQDLSTGKWNTADKKYEGENKKSEEESKKCEIITLENELTCLLVND